MKPGIRGEEEQALEEITMTYEKPELVELGTLTELTEGSTNPVPDDTFMGALSV